LDSGKYEGLWFRKAITTTGWVYGCGSFAVLSLRFFLHSATGAHFLVDISVVTAFCGGSRTGIVLVNDAIPLRLDFIKTPPNHYKIRGHNEAN
jgi:hypothetical protein